MQLFICLKLAKLRTGYQVAIYTKAHVHACTHTRTHARTPHTYTPHTYTPHVHAHVHTYHIHTPHAFYAQSMAYGGK